MPETAASKNRAADWVRAMEQGDGCARDFAVGFDAGWSRFWTIDEHTTDDELAGAEAGREGRRRYEARKLQALGRGVEM